jgi:hypothetical protein
MKLARDGQQLGASKAGAFEAPLRILEPGRPIRRASEHLLATSRETLPHQWAERRHISGHISCARGRAKRGDHDFECLTC